MDPVHVAHLIAVSVWGGLVLAESVLELGANDDESRRVAARLHYRLDLGLELPLLLIVLATGGHLAARAWPWTPLHWLKVGLGLVAVAVNLLCVGAVVARRRHVDDAAAVQFWTRWIRAAGVAVPAYLGALALGLACFRA